MVGRGWYLVRRVGVDIRGMFKNYFLMMCVLCNKLFEVVYSSYF